MLSDETKQVLNKLHKNLVHELYLTEIMDVRDGIDIAIHYIDEILKDGE